MMTTQRQIRRAFWQQHTHLQRRRFWDAAGTGLTYSADTRMAFVDFIDHLARSGEISEALAQRATIED